MRAKQKPFWWAMVTSTVLVAPVGAAEFCGTAGNAEMLWVVGAVPSTNDKPATIRFRYRAHTEPEFRTPEGVAPVTGKVALLAALGTDLHIVYEDGAQWRCTQNGMQVSSRIPSPERPLAWAVSESRNALYAVVPGSVLLRLPHRGVPSTAAATSRPSAATGPTQPAGDATAPPLERALQDRLLADGLARFANGRWERAADRLMPTWLDGHRAVWLAADRAGIHLFYEPAQDGEQIEYSRQSAGSNGWSDPEPIGIEVGGPDPRVALAVNERVLFVHAEPRVDDASTIHLQVVRHTGQAWEPGPLLGGSDPPRSFVTGNVAVTASGQHVAVAERTGPQEIKISTWDAQTGASAGAEHTAGLDLPQPPIIGEEMANWLLIATVSLLFFAALRRRQLARPKSDDRSRSDE